MEPKVFIVILNWNQGAMTLDCLRSLQSLNYANYQVVLVDNGSTDGSPDLVRAQFPECILIESKVNLGYSEGNNLGIRYALEHGADFLLLLNNDTLVDGEMLTRLVQAAQSDPQIGITGPTMFYANPPDMLWGGENRVVWPRATVVRSRMGECLEAETLRRQAPLEADYIDSCAILIKREVLEKVGLFDGRYFINFDDVDFNLRARKAGYKVQYVPGALMWHKVSAAMGVGSPATTYYMTRNSLLFFNRHAPGLWKWAGLARILFNTLRTTAAWSLQSEYRTEAYQRRRSANLLAVRDFLSGRFGRMGADVAQACAGKPSA
ncbi:MAG TPA: glycosyltransferase family 2 protein [Anaerolineales bacterium]